jgi:hypothetical protein
MWTKPNAKFAVSVGSLYQPGEPAPQRSSSPAENALIPSRIKTDTPTKKGSISFLKKRNKKLLLFAPSRRFKWANQVLPLIGKSFLVLFFKKELLPSACLPFSVSRSQRGLV